MIGQGLLKGLSITFSHIFRKSVTEQYPEERPNLPPAFKGSFKLDVPKCISCGICSNSCPNSVIKIESVKDENNKKKLTGYKMLAEKCLYCGLCVEACPTKALLWTQDFENAQYLRKMVNLDLFAKHVPSPEDNQPKESKDEAAQAN